MNIMGDCLHKLKEIQDNSIDSLITDPPAGISFMGKDWDSNKGGSKQWISWMSQVMKECLRVLKPGAHGLVWAIPRTSHWTATALEDAGFEIRDVITHLFGSGFPKSLDISKAIDKVAGAEREAKAIVGPDGRVYHAREGASNGWKNTSKAVQCFPDAVTPEAKLWQGWGTALKPASEHWILVRKPCSENTVAANVLKHGTGGINIDASRIYNGPKPIQKRSYLELQSLQGWGTKSIIRDNDYVNQGRFPANLVLSHNHDCETECTAGCAVAELDRQSGILHPGGQKSSGSKDATSTFGIGIGVERKAVFKDSGGASRFFYCAKASKSDRGKDNNHPTVKSTKLMSYLITMITPPGGIVLDPFMGSGSTGVAAIKSGYKFIGIEKENEYFNISNARIGIFSEVSYG